MKVSLKLLSVLALFACLPLCAQDALSSVPDDQLPERFKETKELTKVLKDLGITVKTKVDHHGGNPFSKDYDVSVNRFTFSSLTPSSGTYGTHFVVQGYIYPAGTFAENGETSGINDDGTPQFPDMVQGVWYCAGIRITDGPGETGASSMTTQIFDFNPDNAGQNTIVTQGFERFDTGLTWYRALTGGTGVNSRARGQQAQIAVGRNTSGMGNLSMSLSTNPWPLLKK